MSIAPVLRTVEVKVPPERAFELFTGRIGEWWKRGMTIGKPHVAIVIEPHVGGRWFERDEDGVETPWGKVLAWEPPGRLLLGWQINSQWRPDPDFLTELELTFAPRDGGGPLVTLEHRNLERYGADAEAYRRHIDGGWPTHLAEFAEFTTTHP